MLLTVTPWEDPGPTSPTPPPTAPKPSKDNARLQRLLRKAAKRGGMQQPPSQPPKSFRSTLSPVNEGELESFEPAVQQKNVPPPLILPPRFQIRPVTHRVSSPYPKQRSFTFTVIEQQSLSQYLCSPLTLDTRSPRPSETSNPNTPIPFPQEPSTPNTLTLLPVKASPSGLPSKESSSCNTPVQFTPEIQVSETTQHTQLAVSQPSISNHHSTSVFIQPMTNLKSQRSVSPRPAEKLHDEQMEIGGKNVSNCISENTKLPITAECYLKTSAARPLKTLLMNQEEVLDNLITSTSTPSKQKELPCITVTTVDEGLSSTYSIGMDVAKLTTPKKRGLKDAIETIDSQSSVSVPSGYSPTILGASCKSPTSNITNISEVTPPSSAQEPLSLPTKETSLLKNPEKPRPLKKKPGGGWARLVKHLIVEPEEPKPFEQQQTGEKVEKGSGDGGTTAEPTQQSRSFKANNMWDALLYRMASSTKAPEKPGTEATPYLPFLRSRLPLLLHRPRFDARKLKEAASRPLRRVTAFFCKKIDNKPAKTFNRTASGWSIRGEDEEQTAVKDTQEEKTKPDIGDN
ncbi:hypothetical protein GDO86_008739 [Hymenochirus boettgeri]|uniref:Uncharacterized protein n=1 Tax=Hymenochirus boettgeri TaxID=247094 RepID=A0A8T2IYP6_9PIPI|nr:hypothetical protein GDO86_008739 [Hymenochirus boettgeri]